MDSGALITISVMTPLSLALLGTLYRLGSIMGRIDEKLGDHERRIDELESHVKRRRPAVGDL